MRRKCKDGCPGILQNFEENEQSFSFKCDICGRIVTQKKRKPNIRKLKFNLYEKDAKLILEALKAHQSEEMDLNHQVDLIRRINLALTPTIIKAKKIEVKKDPFDGML